MKLFLFILSSLFIYSVYGLTDFDTKSKFYETNYLKSDLKRLKFTKCNTKDDCPVYATDCAEYKGIKYCNFKFHCRTDYTCFLEVPNDIQFDLNTIINNDNSTISSTFENTFSVDTENKYKKEFRINTTESKLKMVSSLLPNDCKQGCSKDSDCYSENCEGGDKGNGCCMKNEKIKEYICGPREIDIKTEDLSKLESTNIVCKSSNNQPCSKKSDCFSDVCDYNGFCSNELSKEEEEKYQKEVNVFYVFIILIIVLISSVLLCSLYFGRKVNKPGKGKRKHLLED
ncbi:hypothetical protein PIROE2DRAFT_14540 [Piromyces sp. E2]|nr:hypothetical protein PIROE2DRAFT_14540 [Piromyces sp. E2]|eukprot:OUM59839.1 hypothetical protein PIROE2DRAFT_14540 [Piromyces sp. E2]